MFAVTFVVILIVKLIVKLIAKRKNFNDLRLICRAAGHTIDAYDWLRGGNVLPKGKTLLR